MEREQLKRYLKALVEIEQASYVQERAIAKLQSRAACLGVPQSFKEVAVPERTPNLGSFPMFFFTAVALVLGVISVSFGDCGLVYAFGSIQFVLAIIFLILAIKFKKEQIDSNKSSKAGYYKSVEELERKKAADKKRVKKELAQLPAVREQLNKLKKKHGETQEALEELYALDIIFKKYRNIVAVCSFYEYIVSGRCSTLEGHEGAYNIYENEIRLNLILTKLDDIIDHLDRIEQNQYMLYDAIKEGNVLTNELVKNTEYIAGRVDYIADQSKISAQNAEWTANEVRALEWIEVLK